MKLPPGVVVNKGQGLTVGAVLAASLALHPAMTSAPPAPDTQPANGGEQKKGLPVPEGGSREGPWLASCRYWAPVRSVESTAQQTQEAKANSPDIRGHFGPAENGRSPIDVRLEMSGPELDWGCGSKLSERWGLPGGDLRKATSVQKPIAVQFAPHITATIAIVPDPIHSHLALQFDRAVAAILQGASDNGYVSSSYWLPWARHGLPVRGAEGSGVDEVGHDPEREREPGLIVLKHAPPPGKTGFGGGSSESYYRVIYLFLVAETPTRGMDGFQFRNAIAYEKEIIAGFEGEKTAQDVMEGRKRGVAACHPENPFAVEAINAPELRRGRGCNVSIIGPMFTGSAASLRAGIEDVHARDPSLNIFDVRGETASTLAVCQLTTEPEVAFALPNPLLGFVCPPAAGADPSLTIHYRSFQSNSRYAEDTFVDRVDASGESLADVLYPPIATLTEDDTVLGSYGSAAEFRLFYRFPREISLLRNAQVETGGAANGGDAAPSPYLKLSGKDSGEQDEMPLFSRDNTPLTQEAELMTLSRQLKHDRVKYLVISVPSSTLDQVFLARFLHRSNPDTKLMFLYSDLLMVREVDSAPFLGSITVGPFPMVDIEDRAYSDSVGVAYYNSASMTFWRREDVPQIATSLDLSYHDPLKLASNYQPSLWATAIGTDGYYPLAQLSPCASDIPGILPAFDKDGNMVAEDCGPLTNAQITEHRKPYPVSRFWLGLSGVVGLFCLIHSVLLGRAHYWSTLTRNMSFEDNDEHATRAVYLLVAGLVLFLMAYVLACPVFALFWISKTAYSNLATALVLLALGVAAGGVSVWKSCNRLERFVEPTADQAGYWEPSQLGQSLFWLVCVECLALAGVWSFLCCSNTLSSSDTPAFRGFSFSYRCIHPESGVSPVVPVLLLLFCWHLWSLLLTGRLRFSKHGRPRVPERFEDGSANFYVPMEWLCENRTDGRRALFGNIAETFMVQRLFPQKTWATLERVQLCAFLVTVGLPTVLAFFPFFNGVDHFLWNTGANLSSPYEVVLGVLFYPLFAMALMAWLRVLLIWFSLKRDLLDELESLPIRFAFDRLKGMGWMALMQQGTLQEHWRDMARSIESICQMLNQGELKKYGLREATGVELREIQAEIAVPLTELTQRYRGMLKPWRNEESHLLVAELELGFGEYGKKLLERVLIPHWSTKRVALVESELVEAMPVTLRRSEELESDSGVAMNIYAEPEREHALIVAGEEYIALRYIALIRAVLTSIRGTTTFVSMFFVLAIVAWNSYPFQPRELVDWLVTCLMVVLGIGLVWMFAQMHRNPLLSRATDTRPNELGWDFYLRVAAFGALPLLTWLAYAFPSVGGVLYRIVQPGVSVLK